MFVRIWSARIQNLLLSMVLAIIFGVSGCHFPTPDVDLNLLLQEMGVERRQPQQIFILSGQSNMSGRGGVQGGHWDQVVPPECSPNPSIFRFTATSRWVEAREPLHADIDVNKTCGVGPGMPFANSLLARTSVSCTPASTLGLVPCAVGGTAISEWARGGKLYSDMIARAKQSTSTHGGVIRGVLWYQGESDTDTEAHARAYKANLEKLILDLRSDLGVPDLPFLQVALATGLEEDLLEEVREAQLSVDLPNVVTVDAKGLPLKTDNKVHLSTEGQVVLGKMLADAYIKNFSPKQ